MRRCTADRGAPPADHAAARGARRRARRDRVRALRDHLLPPLVPAGADRRRLRLQARDNRVRKVKIEAPRGNIVDRDGAHAGARRAPRRSCRCCRPRCPTAELAGGRDLPQGARRAEGRRLAAAQDLRELERRLRADGRRSTQARSAGSCACCARQAQPRRARCRSARSRPASPRLRVLYKRLGRVIGMPPATIHKRVVRGIADQPSANVTIRTDVTRSAFNFLLEHREDFPGIVVEKKYLRDYPYTTLGAQLFGTLREISPDELKQQALPRRDARHADRQGRHRGDLRRLPARDRRLHARDRQLARQPRRHAPHSRASSRSRAASCGSRSTSGCSARRNDALQRAIEAANVNGNPADAGAYVAMDPRNGEVLALGSYPSFDANLFAKPIDQETYERLNSEENGAPLFNRAIARRLSDRLDVQADHRASRRVDAGIITPSTPLVDPGVFRYGGREFKNARRRRLRHAHAAARAAGLLRRVLLPARRGRQRARAGASRSGRASSASAQPTGIDLPGEFGGLVPDRKWRDSEFASTSAAQEGEGARSVAGGAVRVRRHRARLERRRQRQPRRRPGRPAGHAAAARHRLRRDRQRRQGRHAAPRPAGRGRRRRASSRRSASRRSGASTSRPARSTRSAPACSAAAGERRHVDRRVRRASPTRSTARRARPSAARTPTSPGTRASSTTRSSRSSSS